MTAGPEEIIIILLLTRNRLHTVRIPAQNPETATKGMNQRVSSGESDLCTPEESSLIAFLNHFVE